MPHAQFTFHGDLVDLVRGRTAAVATSITVRPAFEDAPGIKDTIEALGVPHPEVDAIVVNGRSVGFEQRLSDGDVVDVFPPNDPALPPDAIRLGGEPPVPPRFILDIHLGRLARYLRLLGFDATYSNDADDEELARAAADEGRILLTRDRGLLKRRIVTFGRLIRQDDPRQQLDEVVDRYSLAGLARPYERCVRCNGLIEPVERTQVEHLLEPKTKRYYEVFGRCESCGRVYWKGSHVERMDRLVVDVLARGGGHAGAE